MASLLSALNKSEHGSRDTQKRMVADIGAQVQAKRDELTRLLECISGENTDCLACIRAQWCERRKRKVTVSVIVG
jgi:hypothetical protein